MLPFVPQRGQNLVYCCLNNMQDDSWSSLQVVPTMSDLRFHLQPVTIHGEL